ncbi:MAG: hypothetical protein EZS28_042065, partial [Streblomastix strix]
QSVVQRQKRVVSRFLNDKLKMIIPLPDYIQGEFKDMLKNMLNVDEDKRPTAKELLDTELMQFQAEIGNNSELQTNLQVAEEKAQVAEESRLQLVHQLQQKDLEIHQLRQQLSQYSDNEAELISLDQTGQGMRLLKIGGLNRIAIALKKEFLPVPINKVISEGIYKFETRFIDCINESGYFYGGIGISKSRYQISYPYNPKKSSQRQGNSQFRNGQRIEMEMNMNKGTLHFFVDGTQQPLFVRGINESIIPLCWLYYENSSFEFVSLMKLFAGTAKSIQGEKAIDW